MGLKSAWAYNNGKRWMNECLSQQIEPKTGWIDGKYAERGYENKLWIKTYSNRKQALAKIDKLKLDGIDCEISSTHPFTINAK